MNRFTAFFSKYKHGFLFCYMFLYFPWFNYLEQTVTRHFHVIHMAIDDYIPFLEIFVVPYFLWFAYVAFAMVYFFFADKQDFYRLCSFLFTGMTVFLIISSIYPNGHYLRPIVFERENIFVEAVRFLYATDTPTNLFPSIHVYNALGVHIAIHNSKRLRPYRILQVSSFILMVSIILSTMFLKQHSVFDVITSFVMAALMYSFVYTRDWNSLRTHVPEKKIS